MEVFIQVQGHIQEFFPHLADPVRLFLQRPATVAEILQQAGVPAELPGSILCGGLRVDLGYVPVHGDRLIILSPLAGG